MPKFPDIDSELTCDRALNMILASIAMEELALSHILNAEGEKLQYILGTLETSSCRKPCIEEVLEVNQSITCLLDSVAQNQMILKNKMDRALQAMSSVCHEHHGPPCPPHHPGKCQRKCSAAFKASEKCRIWCPDSALHWESECLQGKCVGCDSCDKTKIELYSKGRFLVNFSANVKSKSDHMCNVAISLQAINNHRSTDLYTAHSQVSDDAKVTVSICGIIVDTFEHCAPDYIMVKLMSPDPLKLYNSMLSIVEI